MRIRKLSYIKESAEDILQGFYDLQLHWSF